MYTSNTFYVFINNIFITDAVFYGIRWILLPIITIRVNDELSQKIEERKGEKTTSAYCRDIIDNFINMNVYNVYNSAETEALKLEMQHKNDTLRLKDERIHDLQNENTNLQRQMELSSQEKMEVLRLLNQSQVLQMQAQKQLTQAQEVKNKTLKWWQIWKK